ncbi:MAG: histidine phosphatase family protein [Prolixibacteraceae bacterium]|jgi:phosphohistidine phosphatase|nr:histidine phosphatase family protein [Prolixibacteraceae bacterium]
MKSLVLVRHAKTIQYGYDQDFDRTLTERGENNADRISGEMVKIGITPDLIIASPAVRTMQTTKIYAGNFGYPAGNVRYEKKLYTGMQTTTFLQLLCELDDRHTTVMVVGHNPTIYFYLELLLPDFSLDVPTCSTIVIDFNIDNWSELRAHSGILAHRWIPDLL